jgi:hypothetical protein
MSGYGKTYLSRWLIRTLAQRFKIIIYNTDFESFDKNPNIIVFDPDKSKVDDLEYLGDVIRKLRATTSNVILYIPDLDVFFDDKSSANRMAKELKNLASTGRHQRFGIIYESKQLQYIPRKMISNANLLFFGNFEEAGDVKALRNYATRSEITNLKKPIFLMRDRWDYTRQLVHLEGDTLVKDSDLENVYK